MKKLRSLLWAWLLCLLLAVPATALTVAGRTLGPDSLPLAGVLISDGVGIVASDQEGRYSLQSAPDRVVAVTAPAGLRVTGPWWLPAATAAAQKDFRLALARPPEGRLRLAIVSDPHLFDASSPQQGRYAGRVDPGLPLRAWGAAAASVKEFAPHLTLLAGDLCMDGDRGSLAHAQAQFMVAARAWEQMPEPKRALPGNHDARYEGGRVDLSLWRQHLGPARHLYMLGPLAVVLLDNPGLGQRPDGRPRPTGHLPAEALAWLKEALALLPPRTPLILVSHYPLASPLAGINPLYRGALVKAAGPAGLALRDVDQSALQIMGLVAGRPLVGLISGHQHALYQARLESLPQAVHLLGAPALCGRWWQGEVVYGPLRFPPGYLQAWLSQDQEGWHLAAQLVRGDWARPAAAQPGKP
ncbi:MAG: metallophosphoesterase [Thermodesulfobacteriota bacterium]